MKDRSMDRAAAGGEHGFSIIEVMIAMVILMVVCGTVMQGVLALTDVSQTVSNRTDMHNGVRNATELLTQEVGQAGRISLPAAVTLAAPVVAGVGNLITVSSSDGMFVGEQLLLGVDNQQETVTVANINGQVITLAGVPGYDHPAGAPVTAPGGFAAGVVPPNAANGSTATRLKIFGDIHDDGTLVYVEYFCDQAAGRLYRNVMPITAGAKAAPGVEQILIDNIEVNPPDVNGNVPDCFTYQTRTVTGTTFVIDVAITLTVRSQQVDKNTGTFARETKALLNVAPRNVFNVWQMASLDIDNRVQPMPPSLLNLLPDQDAVEAQ